MAHPLPDLTGVHETVKENVFGGEYVGISREGFTPMRQAMVDHDAMGAAPALDDPMYAAAVGTGYMSDVFRRQDQDWEKPIRKTIYTVNIGNYAPEITALTYPLMKNYARKIGADFHVITERKFPEWPVVYEKLQVHELARGNSIVDVVNERIATYSMTPKWNPPNDWNIVIDSDALISPEFFDVTDHLTKDTVCHNGRDMAGLRWKYDQYFRRDGRHFGSCNWFTVASDWCLDLWRPLDDLTLEEALTRINTTIQETQGGHCPADHLIDDFTLSRNIARFGLKATTMVEICGKLGMRDQHGNAVNPWLWHIYSCSHEEKVTKMLNHLTQPADKGGWGIMSADEAAEYKRKWGVK